MSDGSEATSYRGSQAFNALIEVHEQVNPRTGSLALDIPLVNLIGPTPATGLDLSLTYGHGAAGILGLPTGWSLSVPHIIGNTLVMNGASYLIDPNWSDSSGYKSGLRYLNDHGARFREVVPPQDLPSGAGGTYSHLFRDVHGVSYYFDSDGKLAEREDRWKNRVRYVYANITGDIRHNRLEQIIGGYGQVVRFSYGPTSIMVTLPDGSTHKIEYSPQGVLKITDPVGQITRLGYSSVLGSAIVSSVEHPTGLTSRYEYQKMPYRNAGGQTEHFPAVKDHIETCETYGQIEWTQYVFGQSTFTGYDAGYKLSGTQDGLMESNDTHYRYSVDITKRDARDRRVMQTRVEFNYLHLPVTTFKYLLAEDGSVVENSGTKTVNAYPDSTSAHSRTASYDKPTRVDTYQWSDTAAAFELQNSSFSEYDPFGMITSHKVAEGTGETVQSETVRTYTKPMSWGGPLPASTVETDHVLGTVRRTEFTPTPDMRAIAQRLITFGKAPDTALSAWKTHETAFDDMGRKTLESIAWTEAGSREGGPERSQTGLSYAYDTGSQRLTVTTTDPGGNTSNVSYDASLPHGPIIEQVDQLGHTSRIERDPLARRTAVIDAVGNTTRFRYEAHQTDGRNAMIEAKPSGFTTCYEADGIGRVRKVLDDGVAGTSGSLSRTVSKSTYGPTGLVEMQTDATGATTRHSFDALRRRIETVDPRGNVETVTYGGETVRHAMNGKTAKLYLRNGLGHVVRVEEHSWTEKSSDRAARKIHEMQYDGKGKLKLVRLSCDSGDATVTLLQQKTYARDIEGHVIKAKVESHCGQEASVEEATERDLFGNAIRHKRRVTYADGRVLDHTGELHTYDAANQLTSITNALGQVTGYKHDAAGYLAETVRPDGTIIRQTHTPLGQVAARQSADTDISFRYTADGQIAEIASAAERQKMDRYSDGSLKTVSYPDGATQAFAYDEAGRLAALTDPAGFETQYSYDDDGHLDSVRHRGDTLTFAYADSVGIKKQLAGYQLSGQAALSVEFGRDAYNRTRTVLYKDADVRHLGITQDYDPLGRLETLTETRPEDQTRTDYRYDGLNQVISETRSTATQTLGQVAYSYDANGNVLTRTRDRDGRQNVETFEYNAIDQLTTPKAQYDKNGRMIAAPDGTKYRFNDIDQLLKVEGGRAGNLGYSYHPDGTLATRSHGSQAETFYYHSGQVNARKSSNDAWTTYLFAGSQRLAEYRDGTPPLLFLSGNGSIRAQLRGTTRVDLAYSAYGELHEGEPNAEAVDSRFLWKEEFSDDVAGIVYLRARFYHPGLMRFVSMDSYPLANRYAFASGDPVNLSDPSGHSEGSSIALDIFGILLGVVAAAAAPFTGGSSLSVTAGVAGGLLGAASSTAALVNDTSATGNQAAADVSTALAVGGFLLDFASAAVSAANVAKAADKGASAAEAGAEEAAYIGQRQAGRHPTINVRTEENTITREFRVQRSPNVRESRPVRVHLIGRTAQARRRIIQELDDIYATGAGRDLIRSVSRRTQDVFIHLQAPGSGFAEVAENVAAISVNFRPTINILGGGSAEVESLSRVIAHELGHVAFPLRTEQEIVDACENPVAEGLGLPLRGQY